MPKFSHDPRLVRESDRSVDERIRRALDADDPLSRAMERAGFLRPPWKRDPTMGDVTDPDSPARPIREDVLRDAVRGLTHVPNPLPDMSQWCEEDAYNLSAEINRERCGIRVRLRPGKSKTDDASREHAAKSAQEVIKRLLKPPYILEKPTVSRGDDMAEQYFRTKKTRNEPESVRHSIIDALQRGLICLHSFLIEHDWSAVLRGATAGVAATEAPEGAREGEALAGEWMLPFELCTFELRINGVHVVILANQLPAGAQNAGHGRPLPAEKVSFRYGFRVDKNVWGFGETFYDVDRYGWHPSSAEVAPGPVQTPFIDLLYQQMRACCIMLDAEVAVAPTIREPYRSNRMPQDPGAPMPAFSFHTVSLNRKGRADPYRPPGADDPDAPHRRSPRLHFRRGHWRRFAAHRTWVKWMLVGDPDLGWVEKDYKL